MKKTILVATLFLAMSATMQAQTVKFGIKAGLNYANPAGTDITVNNTNYKGEAITSYHAGLVAEVKLLDKFSVQPELMYSTVGASYDTKTVLGDVKNELGYLSIPVMAKIYLSNNLSLEVGPQASFLLSERKAFVVKDSNTFDFAAAGGLGLKITKSIFIQGRYVLGLTEISKDAQAKNSVVQVSAGILF